MPTIQGEDGSVKPQPEVSSTSGGTLEFLKVFSVHLDWKKYNIVL